MPAPTDISGMTHRFRASKLGLADGSLVSAAAFEAGGITLAQGTLANQPKYTSSSINGLAGIRFNGSNSWMSGSNPTVLNQPFTVTLILKFNYFDQYGNQEILYSSGFEFGANFVNGNQYGLNVGGQTIAGAQPSTGAHAITVTCATGNVTSFYVDGRLAATGTLGAGVLADFRLGLYTDGSRAFNGDICEIITYNKTISAAERTTLDSYIQSTYAIQMADVTGSDTVTGISGLLHRFRAHKLTAYTNGAYVSNASFETGGVTLTQNTGGNQPVYTTNSINNIAGLTFNGNNYWMDATVSSAINPPFTISAIVKIGDTGSWQEIVNTGNGAVYVNNTNYAFFDGTSVSGGTVTSGAHAITVTVAASGATSVYVDGAMVTNGNAGSGSITSYAFGRNTSSGRYFNGDICEYVLYGRVLSVSELSLIDSYFQGIYNIRMDDVPATVIATESWTAANGAPWPSQWTGTATRTGGIVGSASVQSNMGVIYGGSSDSTYKEFLSGMIATDNMDLVVSFTLQVQDDHYIAFGIDSDNTVASNSYYGLDPVNGYWLLLHTSTNSGNTSMNLYKNTVQGRTDFNGGPTQTTVAGTSYTIRLQRYGTRVRAKYWASASSEPATWQIETIDTGANGTVPPGRVFISVINNYTNGQPVMFDNMTVSSPGAPASNMSLGRYVRSKDIPSLIISASGIQASSLQVANYTLLLTDAGRAVEMNVTATNTVTIPPNSSVAFPVGTYIDICQVGTGVTSLIAGAGVTLDISQGSAVYARYASLRIRQRAINEWIVTGSATPFYDPTTINGYLMRMRGSTIGINTEGTAVSSAPFEAGGITLTQPTASSQPIWHARGRNGKPYITFDGVDDSLFVSSGVGTYNQPLTVCIAAQIYNGLSSQEVFKAGGIEILLNQSANTWSTYAGTLINSPVIYSGVQYFTGVFGASGSQGSIQNYTNGTLTASGGGGGNSTGGGDLYIGTHPNTPRYLSADVYELLVFNATLSSADLTKLHAYMQATYL